MKNATQKMIRESKRRAMERAKNRQGGQGGKAPSMSDMMQNLDDLDGELPQVKLGDASMAALFTSRLPTIRSAVDIIRQGRCTLVSSIQMQQVLVLSCLISAFSLSVLYTDGIRSSDNQMMASGLCLTAAGLAFSYATPVHTLSPVRPLRSIFHPALFLSIIGQLVIHVFVMSYATELVHAATGEKAAFPEAIPVAKVSEEEKKMPAKRRDRSGNKAPFELCLLNTVIFLIETVQRVCVMLVNYKGRPFMMGSLENKTLLLSFSVVIRWLVHGCFRSHSVFEQQITIRFHAGRRVSIQSFRPLILHRRRYVRLGHVVPIYFRGTFFSKATETPGTCTERPEVFRVYG